MPLCHWPCSCYPNYSLGQTDDWMNEIYPLWVAAHGIMIVTPVNWYQAPTGLKAMIDRLVCADGGNPDPTSTHGKKPDEAKALELKGWPYPRHLAGRHFARRGAWRSVGAETLRRSLVRLAHRHVAGVGRPHRRGRRLHRLHGALRDIASGAGRGRGISGGVRNVARALGNARASCIAPESTSEPDEGLDDPNPK